MRLDTITAENWIHQSPYVDTIVLPLASITFREKKLEIDPYKMVTEIAIALEQKLMGRLLLLPTFWHSQESQVDDVIEEISSAGFQFVILLVHKKNARVIERFQGDSVHTYIIEEPSFDTVESISQAIVQIWENGI